jgi:malate dehydrogenase
VAQTAALRLQCDVAMVDINEGLAAGKALDLSQAMSVEGKSARIEGGSDYALLADSSVVVVTAGVARKPGMSRDDLLAINAGIVKGAAEEVKKRAPEAVVIVVTNPLDVMTWLAWKATGFPAARVMGMAGVLDSARFSCFISRELGVSITDVSAMVLGGHGDTMVPLPRYTTVSGVPITDLMPAEAIAKLAQRTRDGGAEIVALLKTGSAYYAPGGAAAMMAECVLLGTRRMLPAAAVLEGQYGERDLCLGVPVILGAGGVEKIIELPLSADEKAALKKSAESVHQGIAVLKERKIA